MGVFLRKNRKIHIYGISDIIIIGGQRTITTKMVIVLRPPRLPVTPGTPKYGYKELPPPPPGVLIISNRLKINKFPPQPHRQRNTPRRSGGHQFSNLPHAQWKSQAVAEPDLLRVRPTLPQWKTGAPREPSLWNAVGPVGNLKTASFTLLHFFHLLYLYASRMLISRLPLSQSLT